MSTAEEIARLRAAALRQPGAKERAGGYIKFGCPACIAEGHDEHRDNAGVFPNGKWGCAWATGDPERGRAHWGTIGEALGAFDHAPPEVPNLAPLGVGLGAFLAQTFDDVEPYITDLLSAEGSGFLGGEEKTCKTWYALHEALCLAFGHPVLGRFPVPTCRRVLFIEEEDPPRRTWVRIRALLAGLGWPAEPCLADPHLRATLDRQFRISVWEGTSLDDPISLARLEATLIEFKPQVVYLDVLRKLTTKDLNKAHEASALLAVLDRFRRRYQVLFRVLHHFRKLQGFRIGRGSQELGGSYILGAWIESGLSFEAVGRRDGHVRVTAQNKDSDPIAPFRLQLETEGPRHAPTVARLTAVEDKEPSELDEPVYQAVATLPPTPPVTGHPGVSREQIQTHLKRSKTVIVRALARLEAAGRILTAGFMVRKGKLYGVNVKTDA